MSKKPISLRVDETLLEDMQTVSEMETRSLTNLIESVMKKYCEEKLRSNKKKNLKPRKR